MFLIKYDIYSQEFLDTVIILEVLRWSERDLLITVSIIRKFFLLLRRLNEFLVDCRSVRTRPRLDLRIKIIALRIVSSSPNNRTFLSIAPSDRKKFLHRQKPLLGRIEVKKKKKKKKDQE